MPYLDHSGVRLYYEEHGSGTPIVFVHEFGGDHRAWAPQVAHFKERYRCIVYGARGYPPSDVPSDPGAYSQEMAMRDCAAVVEQLELAPAHLVGLSMGGSTLVQMGIHHPDLARSLTIVGCGSGSMPEHQADFLKVQASLAETFASGDLTALAATYSKLPARRRLGEKSPEREATFMRELAEHSRIGAASTIRGVQMRRPSVLSYEAALRKVSVPALVITGDEDIMCVGPSLFLAATMANAALAVYPRTGHTLNLEEPERFNADLTAFFAAVETGRWKPLPPV